MNERSGIVAASRSEKGRRTANEDACLALTGDDLGGGLDGLFVVADGMGGRASGSAASVLTVEAVRGAVTSALNGENELDPGERLARSLQAANSAVFQKAGSSPELEGMGATCVAAAVGRGRLFVAHMGDSRAYLLREGRLHRLTEDHSFVAEKVRTREMTEDEARTSRFRNVITKAVGLEPAAEPEVSSTDMLPGDMLLLCTDGLTGPVQESEIADILGASSSVDEACGSLVKAALRNGGSDNVTVVLAEGGGRRRAGRSFETSEGRGKRFLRWLLPAVLGLVLGIAVGLFTGWMLLLDKSGRAEKDLAIPPPLYDLQNMTYESAVSLLYTPLQNHVLSLQRDHLYVMDTQGHVVKVDTSGRVLYEFPGRGAPTPQSAAKSPMTAVDGQGNVYVSEPADKRIAKYGPDGVFLGSIGENDLLGPQAIVVDDTGNLYVIDGGRLKFIKAVPMAEEAADSATGRSP